MVFKIPRPHGAFRAQKNVLDQFVGLSATVFSPIRRRNDNFEKVPSNEPSSDSLASSQDIGASALRAMLNI